MDVCKELFTSEFFDALGELNEKDSASPCFNNCSIGRIRGKLNGICKNCDFGFELAKIEKLSMLLEFVERLSTAESREENYQVLFTLLSRKRKQIAEAIDRDDLEKIKFFELCSVIIGKNRLGLSLKLLLED